MRTRLVFWGKNGHDEKVLLGLKLNEKENDVDVYIFSESQATEEFVTAMHQKWRLGEDIDLPENYVEEKRPLSISESLLPPGYSVDRDDILKRAQTEWHFVVLSAKLFESYHQELADLKERVSKLSKFDTGIWEELKGFWSKVQEQVREKNLFHDHATKIKEHTNELFSELKQLRKALDKEFQALSEERFVAIKEQLQTIEKKIEDGLSLQPIFQELKDIQRSFRNTKFTGEHRGQLWKKIDRLFKVVKEKKFGPEAASSWSNPLERVQRRYKGLLDAIEKMQRSITRDQKDLAFQQKRIESAEGSLESQIRVAKTKMIEERIQSKEHKLTEMHKTKGDLERRIRSLESKEEAKKEREKVKAAKEEIKAKIAEEIRAAERDREKDEALQRAVQSLSEKRDAVIESVEDGLEDVVDTIKAIASVIETKVDQLLQPDSQEEE